MTLEVESALQSATKAQVAWYQTVVRKRLKLIGRIASRLASDPIPLADAIPRPNANRFEKIASEIFPLADACRFLAKSGRQILAPKSHGILSNLSWLGRVRVRTIHEAWGVVLVVAPSNYPLFLPAVQIVQALAAGNAVLVKPAPGCTEVLERFHELLVASGIPADLLQILPTPPEAVHAALQLGVDKVVFTGSHTAGVAILESTLSTLTPSTLELSGCDAAFVLPQADLQKAAQCIAYGICLNGGATCVAPRRIFVTHACLDEFSELLISEISSRAKPSYEISAGIAARVTQCVQQASQTGAKILLGSPPELSEEATGPVSMQPIVLRDVVPSMQVASADLFAPITSLMAVSDMPEALAADSQCPYHLGASVFGPSPYSDHWAEQINAGTVVLNDLIVPTADPRVAFGGRGRSGWGVTRGAEGLLEMTRPKTICTRKGNWLPHLDEQGEDGEAILTDLLRVVHSDSIRDRLTTARKLAGRMRKR